MLHDENRINGHPRSEESINLIREYLVKCHQDNNSLFVRFCELQKRIELLEREASYLRSYQEWM